MKFTKDELLGLVTNCTEALEGEVGYYGLEGTLGDYNRSMLELRKWEAIRKIIEEHYEKE